MLNPKTGKPWRVYMGLPSVGNVTDFQAYMLRDLEKRYKGEVELVYPEVLCQRIFHDYARCGVVEDFLKTDCDVLWFLDSDIAPAKHVLDLLTLHGDKWQCAAAPYPVFMSQPGESFRQVVFTLYKGTNGKAMAPGPIPFEGTDWVDGAATGCLFIKREVFDKLSKPYFEFKYDAETRQPIEGEDIGFALKMHRLGIKFFTDYSMVCKHYKNICLLEVNNYCVDYCNKAIKQYDAQVRQGVKQHLTQQKNKQGLELWEKNSKLIIPGL